MIVRICFVCTAQLATRTLPCPFCMLRNFVWIIYHCWYLKEALTRLRWCTGWSAPLLFACCFVRFESCMVRNPRRQIFLRRGPFIKVMIISVIELYFSQNDFFFNNLSDDKIYLRFFEYEHRELLHVYGYTIPLFSQRSFGSLNLYLA